MKPWAYAIILAAVLAAFGTTYAVGHNTGYDKKEGEIQRDILDAVAEAEKKKDEDWQKLLNDAEAEIIVEEKIVTEIQYVEREIPTVVREIVEVKPECRDLGDSYAGLLNNQVRAANGVQDTEPAPVVVSGVP